jgi:UDP-N-acetylglucosamine 2-epimerase (non-hydrolysing)
MHVLHVVGARPNFMKAAPVMRALEQRGASQTLVHTGQHYDANMSEVFFTQLGIPAPDVNLEVGSGSHALQTAEIMMRIERELVQRKPDLVLVYGDVNSTMAAALVCSKVAIRVGHVEAGLRSFDSAMPEGVNRVVTDQLADLLFTPSKDGDQNLKREGVSPAKVHCVGNVMIDTLIRLLPAAEQCNGMPDRYALVTLHRPSNVDSGERLGEILDALREIGKGVESVSPVHPRTRQRIAEVGLSEDGLQVLGPLPYIEFLALQKRATLVITDSGGVQEETTFLKVPCLTLRTTTERPVTVSVGSNVLVGEDLARLKSEAARVLSGQGKQGCVPELWDGRAAERIADIVMTEAEC